MTQATQDRINQYLANGGKVLQVPKDSKWIVVGGSTEQIFEIKEEEFQELLDADVIELEKYTTLVMKFRKVVTQ
jgi:hypothetical protein